MRTILSLMPFADCVSGVHSHQACRSKCSVFRYLFNANQILVAIAFFQQIFPVTPISQCKKWQLFFICTCTPVSHAIKSWILLISPFGRYRCLIIHHLNKLWSKHFLLSIFIDLCHSLAPPISIAVIFHFFSYLCTGHLRSDIDYRYRRIDFTEIWTP